MTITKTGFLRKDYTATGSDTFPFDFIIYDQDYLSVYVDGVLQTVDIDYTIASDDVENSSGGDVVFEVASTPSAGSTVVLLSTAPYTQDTSLATRDTTFEDTYDKAVILIKQLNEKLNRAILLDAYSTYDGLTLPDPVASNYIRWKSDLSGFENVEAQDRGNVVDKTISGGAIVYTSGDRHIKLSGQGDVADVLTDITGGTEGDTVTLWREYGVAYSIVITPGSGLYTQANASFTLNNNYDNITFVAKGSNVWVETGGRVNVD